MDYEDEDDYEDAFVCVICGDLVFFDHATFTSEGAICPECAEARRVDAAAKE